MRIGELKLLLGTDAAPEGLNLQRLGTLIDIGEHAARQLIDRAATTRHPFDSKYSKVEDAERESCSTVLDQQAVKDQFLRKW